MKKREMADGDSRERRSSGFESTENFDTESKTAVENL